MIEFDVGDGAWMDRIPMVPPNRPDSHEHYYAVRVIWEFLHGITSHEGIQRQCAFLSVMKKEDALSRMLYDNRQENPEQIVGLSAAWNTTDPGKAQNARCVQDAGGRSKNLTSMWLICWGSRTVCGLAPSVEPDYSGPFKFGYAPIDWRYIQRVANIDATTHSPDDIARYISAMAIRAPFLQGTTNVLYMNEEVFRLVPVDMMKIIQRSGVDIYVTQAIRNGDDLVE